MGVLKYKIIRDLWGQKLRTLQVVLIIAIGAAAIGMIISTRNLMVPNMQRIWRSMNAAMINIGLSSPINDDDVISLGRVEEVKQIEGMSSATIEWRLNPQDEWKPGGLTARADYKHQQLNKMDLLDGRWPTDTLLANGQDNASFYNIPDGQTVYLRVNDRVYAYKVGGTVYNQLVQPAYFGGTAQFYTTRDGFDRMVGFRDFNTLLVSGAEYDEKKTGALGDVLQEKLKKQDIDSSRFVVNPDKHIFQDTMDGIFFLMGAMGLLALILGLLLVYNTINAVITQQVNQIGIMKAIGGRTSQVLGLFLTMVFIYGILALIIAIPAGVLLGWMITAWLAGSFGADLGAFQTSPAAIIAMVAICLLAPMIAALIPIYSGSRITVREAISSYGLSANAGLLERLLNKIRLLSRMALLTISNTFRNKWRVVLMEITLVLSGLIFMMVLSVRDSVNYTVRDIIFSILNANITMIFDNPQRNNYIEDLTMAYPGIKAVEMWGLTNARIRPASRAFSEDDKSTTVLGVPLPTKFYGYQLRGGRWLNPNDTYAIVLNKKLADDVGVGVGDWVTLKYPNDKERNWQVVGLVFDPVLVNSSNLPRDLLLRDLGSVGKGYSVWIQTNNEDLASENAIAKELRTYYKKNGVEVSAQRGLFGMGDSTAQTAATLINQFNFLVILLGIMAVIIGLVGSIALSGALSLSVIERKREIGVMRAIGASSWAIARLFVGEGLILGWLSWLIAVPLSVPAGRLMGQALGAALKLDLVYKYSPVGAILWLVIITILSILASWLPAHGASRISVRESLAYQ